MYMKKILCCLCVLALTACGAESPPQATPSPDPSPAAKTLSVDKHTGRLSLLYDPGTDEVYSVKKASHGYTLFFTVRQGVPDSSPVFRIKSPSGTSYRTFQFDDQGTLYAAATHGKKHCVYRFSSRKKAKKLPLSPAPASPVQQLLFSGSAMALVYKDRSVSLYNLIEYQQLGQTTLKGQADSSLLYDCHFLVQIFQSQKNLLLFQDINWRTGDTLLQYPLLTPAQKNDTLPMCRQNDTLYLLRNRTLFAGKCGDAQFNKVFSLEPYVEDGFTPIKIVVTRDNRLLVQGREKDSSHTTYETALPARQEGPAASLSS
ncbi:MAG: hypothetical protein SOT18_02030 [Eubacterium sp.]|nr:hypothetical protein [Eubacterium sp.]